MATRAEKRKLRKKKQRQRKRIKLGKEKDAHAPERISEPTESITPSTEQIQQLEPPIERESRQTHASFSAGSLLAELRSETKVEPKQKQNVEDKSVDKTTPTPTTVEEPIKVYAAWYGEVGCLKERPKRRYQGLRCKKCFVLLARDQDFEYRNNQLWINQKKVPKNWDGLVIRNSTVFCQNMHNVGKTRRSTFANMSRYVPILTVDKTTFKANFLDNPDFADSELIKNKLNYNETHSTDWLKIYLPPKELLPKFKEGAVPDRYHVKEAAKYSGVNNWRDKMLSEDP